MEDYNADTSTLYHSIQHEGHLGDHYQKNTCGSNSQNVLYVCGIMLCGIYTSGMCSRLNIFAVIQVNVS